MNNNLKEIRQGAKLTLEALSKMSDISAACICKIEGGVDPQLKTAYAIAGALDVDIYSIFPDINEFEERTEKPVTRRFKKSEG